MVTDEQIRQVYRGLLRREPEEAAFTPAYRAQFAGMADLMNAVLQSPEWISKHPVRHIRNDRDLWYDGLHGSDQDLLIRHLSPKSPEDGFVMNFTGVRMRTSHVEAFNSVSGVSYTDIPTRQADYHAQAIEFVGTLKAVEASKDRFVGVELGAGWGSWSVIAGVVARRLGRTPIRLYAVEGSAGKVANMAVHYRDNGFDPVDHHLVHAVIGSIDGYALFPPCDVVGDWGAEAVFSSSDEEREGYDRVRSVTIQTSIEQESIVDLIHFDVQGVEADVVSASLDTLSAKVRYLVIATHSRSIEGRIMDLLLARGWALENEQPAQIHPTSTGKEMIHSDGTQVWRNPAL